MTKACATCRFSHGDTGLGYCRRRAPAVLDTLAKWPRIEPDDWCGEYEEAGAAELARCAGPRSS